MKIRTKIWVGVNPPGTVLDLSRGAAITMIEAGTGEEVKEPRKRTPQRDKSLAAAQRRER